MRDLDRATPAAVLPPPLNGAHLPSGPVQHAISSAPPATSVAVAPATSVCVPPDPLSAAGSRLEALRLAPTARTITAAQRERYESHLAEILGALGLDLGSSATRDTPRRLLSALIDATDGYDGDPKLITSFATECRGGADCELAQIIEGPIPFSSLCEHHALPFVGSAWLGYVAHEEILGISKLTRLVRVVTRRFAVQERLTHGLADALADLTQAHGVAVYLEAEHMCVRTRGVREHGSRTRTTAYRGVYRQDPTLRDEFRTIAGIGRGER